MDNKKAVYVLDMAEKFECMGADCPYTCCKGWQVCLDDDTKKLYGSTGGIKGLLYAGACRNKDGTTVLRKICGRCPFHTFRGWCGLQLHGKEEYMPLVCRMYPRCSFVYGDRQEVTLELSCFAAARDFVIKALCTDVEQYGEWFGFGISEKEYPVEWELNDPDPAFIDFLLSVREKVQAFLYADNKNIAGKIRNILDYIHELHLLVAQDDIKAAEKVEIGAAEDSDEYVIFPVRLMNEHIYGVLEDSRIVYREPFLYRILKKYRKIFGGLWEYEADGFLNEQAKKMLTENPDLERLIYAYFGYTFTQSLMTAAEDYYMLRPVVMSAVLTQFLITFMLTRFLDGQSLDTQDLAALIANMEKGIAHNPYIMETIMKSINELWFKHEKQEDSK